MVICVFLHMCRVFYTGSYKRPRQFNWVIGVVLFLLTLGLSFTGYLLPWDQLAFWAITVGTNIGSYAPLVGARIRELLLGGHTVGESALLRFYVLHVAVLPAVMTLLTMVHFWRVRKDGGLSRPVWKLKEAKSAQLVTIGAPDTIAPLTAVPASKDKTYGLMEVVTGKPIFETVSMEEEEDTVFSYPYAFFREGVALLVTVATVMAVSIFWKAPLEELANPAKTPNPAKAPWYFLGLQELVSHSALLGGVIVPGLAVLALIAIPYIDPNPSRRPADRKWAIRAFTLFVVVNVVLIVGTETTAVLLRAEPDRAGSDAGGHLASRHSRVENVPAGVPPARSGRRTQRRGKKRRIERRPGHPAGPAARVAARRPLHHLPPWRGRPDHEECAAALRLSPKPGAARPRQVRLHRLPRRAGACHRPAERARKGAVLAGAAAAQGIHPRFLRAVP
jgi:quinol-cytochrome oxidoreductase complex cytochrome b subunit